MSTATISKFELTGSDGGPLRGEVRTAASGFGRPPIVICHGFRGCKDWGFFPELADRVARAGMTAVSFNFSGSGVATGDEGFSEPERFAHSSFSGDVRDIEIVTEALCDGGLVKGLVDYDRYALFGYSRGGGAAVLHAAGNDSVRCLVTWAAISHTDRWDADVLARWRAEGKRMAPGNEPADELFFYTDMLDDIIENAASLDIAAAAGKVTAPWLILHNSADDFVPKEEGETLFAAAEGETAKLEVIEGGSHSFDGEKQLQHAIDRTLAWFARHLF